MARSVATLAESPQTAGGHRLAGGVGAGVAGAAFSGGCARQPETSGDASSAEAPSYLEGYEDLYASDPHAAAIEWFNPDFRFRPDLVTV